MPAINRAMRDAAAGGVTDLRSHLGSLIETVRDAPSDVEALGFATEVFGAEGAQRMVVAIRSGAVPSLDEMAAAAVGSSGAVTQAYKDTATLSDKLVGLKNKAASYLTVNPQLVQGIAGVATGLGAVVTVAPSVGLAFKAIWASSLGPIGLVSAAVIAVGAAVYGFRDKVAEVGAFVVTWLVEKIGSRLEALEKFVGVFSSSLAAKIAAGRKHLEGLALNVSDKLLDFAKGVRGAGGTEAVVERLGEKVETTVRQVITPALVEIPPLLEAARLKVWRVSEHFEDAFKQAMLGIGQNVRRELQTVKGDFSHIWSAEIPDVVSSGASSAGEAGGGGFMRGFFDRLTGQGDAGGGGFLGRMGGFMQTIQGGWKGIVTAGLNMVPVVGPLMASFGPALMKGIAALAGKVWGAIKSLFGGPDKMEQEGRRSAAAFRAGFGGPEGLHVAIRDAATGAGETAEAAEAKASALVKELWKAEKAGGAAVESVAERIRALIAGQEEETAEVVATGAAALTGHTEASLLALRRVAVDVYADAGAAAEAWAKRGVGAADAVLQKLGEVAVMLDSIAGARTVKLSLELAGDLPDDVVREVTRQVLIESTSARQDAAV